MAVNEFRFSDALRYPTGTIRVIDLGQPLPEGWLWCNGSMVSSHEYPDLAAAIAPTFGEGIRVEEFLIPYLEQAIIKT